MTASPNEQAAVLALVGATKSEWHRTANLIEEAGSALRIIEREWRGYDITDRNQIDMLLANVGDSDLDRYRAQIAELVIQGVTLHTVLDDEYPINLRQVYNRPPFMFVRGSLSQSDDRAVAVVGTRKASPEGLDRAYELARGLAEHGITVLSGMAEGIDTAAHTAALEAGGRTVAVMGTGINRIYPKSNQELAKRIAERGAAVSQFWPDAPPTKSSFPMRNVVMSGMAIGTAVIEASDTSGAKNQARRALEHGKLLFLTRSLVETQDWARKYSAHPGATVVDSAGEIIEIVRRTDRPVQQLRLA